MLIKAPSVIVMRGEQKMKVSARNQLPGKVVRLKTGAVNSEVVIELPGGVGIAAILTSESADHLGLAVGQEATAIFKASSVIIAVAA